MRILLKFNTVLFFFIVRNLHYTLHAKSTASLEDFEALRKLNSVPIIFSFENFPCICSPLIGGLAFFLRLLIDMSKILQGN